MSRLLLYVLLFKCNRLVLFTNSTNLSFLGVIFVGKQVSCEATGLEAAARAHYFKELLCLSLVMAGEIIFSKGLTNDFLDALAQFIIEIVLHILLTYI